MINGHIGFNEPGASFDGTTSVVDLTESTINANKRFFDKAEDVPTKAVSMGIGSVKSTTEVVPSNEAPGSLKPICPFCPIPKIWISIG